MTRVALSNLNGGACKSIARLNQFRNENKLSWRNSETLLLKKSDLYNWIDRVLTWLESHVWRQGVQEGRVM